MGRKNKIRYDTHRSKKRVFNFSDHRSHGGHFIIPESLGGQKTKDNVYTPWAGHNNPQHVAWHILFGDSLPEEAISRIRVWTKKTGDWDSRYFTRPDGKPNKRLKARKILFGDKMPAECIAWIEKEFIRKEWLKG